MATASWVAELDKKEHKNWVKVACALNIAKNGITHLIQGEMEAWYQSLISNPPLQSLAPCTCVPGSPKCGTCVTWERELKRYHKSKRPMICWDNSDRKQWGSPTGAWEVAKLFMPTLGRRKTQVIDADTTDIGGLLNLLEWCPFIYPSVSRTVLSSARDKCRNHWAHAPKQELQDADGNTIFGHLNRLLNDPVFNADKAAQKSSKDLQDLFNHGLVNVRESEVAALHLLRQSLVADLTKCRDDLDDVQDKVVQLDAESKKVDKTVQKDMSDVREQGDLNKEEIDKLRSEVYTAREDLTKCQDETKKVNESVKKDISEVKEQGGLNKEEIVKLRTEVHTAREDMTRCQDELDVKTKKVNESVQKDISEVKEQGGLNKEEIVKLRTEVHTAREDMTRCQDELDAKTKKVSESVQKDISEVKEQGECSKEEIAKLRQELDTEVSEVKEEISMILNTVENFNTQLNERDDLRGAIHHISEDVEYVKHGVQIVAMELTTTKSQVAELEIGLTSVRSEVKGMANEVATNTNTISGLQKHVMEVKEDVETLKAKPSQGQNDDDIDKLFTAPSRLTAFTGRESALEWLEQNLVSDQSPEDCPRMSYSCCTKAICGLGGCGKTSLAVEFAWRCTSNFPGGVFWINGESDENIRKSVAENLALVNNPASTSESIDDILNTFLALLSKKKLPWLLLLDNTDELQDPTCPTGVKKICKGPWQRNGNASKLGHILFTTRQNAKDTKTFLKLSSDDCLELQCFSEEEGALFLMQRTGSKGDSLDTEAISLLVNELGALPLALEQAAAYISALPIPCSFKAYLDKYLAVKLRLLKQQSATALSVEAQHRLSVHTTWEINFEFVTEKSPAAATMMRIAAFLESENIPIDVINPGFPKLDQVELRDAANSEIDIAAILKVLTSYSLFSVDQQRRVFSVHKLVQEVVRDSLTISARTEALVAATRVLHFAFLENSEPCSELAKYVQSRNLSATKKEDRNILVALLLNFCKLKKHLEDELTMPKGNSTDVLFNDDTSNLCSFVFDLCKNNISLHRLSSDLSDFNLRVLSMVHTEDDPNLLLFTMVDTSISKRNCSSPESYKDAKELSENTVQKLVELEKSGAVIGIDIKYKVLLHRASYYALEGQWEKNYKALLKLEDLPLSDANIVDLQMCIGRAENYVSACNFQSVLRRYENALKIARRIYPPDHPELLRLLQFINSLFYNEGKLHDAKPYAEEMLEICKKLPSSSDAHIRGMTSAFQVIRKFDPISSENMLLETLKDRWPHIYKSAKEGYFDADSKTIVDDGSDSHVTDVLVGVMECLFNARTKRNFSTSELNFYRTIAEILLYIQKKFYGDIHRGMVGPYCSLIMVHSLLKNFKEVSRLYELVSKCQQGESKQLYQRVPCDYNMYNAREQKDFGKNLFRAGDYSGALQCYNQALTCLPNDAKLLTNRSATYVQLSKQQSSADDERNYLEHALQDSENAIAADPSWVKGYYRKAVCLAHLGKRGPSLAAAAVAKHLFPSQCATILAVVDRFGCYDALVVTTVQDLLHLTERADSKNLVIVVKEGRYELPNPLQVPENAVMVGHGEVQITCSKGVPPLKLDKTVYMENITLSPTMESIKKLKEKAKRCLNHGQVDAALSLYNEALILCPNDPQILTCRASTYLKSAEQKKDLPSERKSLLELALNNAEAAIRADPTWLLGYYTKATSLAELDRKQQALAAAAVFKHLSSGRDVPVVAQRYGGLQVQVVESSDQLRCVFERIKELEGVNQVVLMKEGEYLLEKSVQISQQIVIVGQGKVTVSCKIGAPFRFTQACHVENVQIIGDCDNDQEPQDCNSSDTQSDVISLDTPSGYEHTSNECKVN